MYEMLALLSFMMAFVAGAGVVSARSSRRTVLGFDAKLKAARWTRISDAGPGARVVIAGRVVDGGGQSITAPFSGDAAVWARARAQSNVGTEIDSWVRRVEEITIDDGSGCTARVPLDGAVVKLDGGPFTDSKKVSEYFDRIERSPGSGEFHYEAVLRVGDSVSVLGTVAAVDTYRTNAKLVTLHAGDDDLALFDRSTQAWKPEGSRYLLRLAWFGVALFAAITVLFAALAYGSHR